MIKDPMAVQNVLQEVFIKIWDNAHELNWEKKKLLTWMYTIARHTALNHNKYESRYKIEILDTSQSENALSIKATNIDTINLIRSMDSLPYALKAVIEKSFYQGLTVCEIAKELNISAVTVKSRMRAALEQLRKYEIG